MKNYPQSHTETCTDTQSTHQNSLPTHPTPAKSCSKLNLFNSETVSPQILIIIISICSNHLLNAIA